MARPKAEHPTDGEIAILAVLWENGPLTVRGVKEILEKQGKATVSTLKLMQIMVEKKLLDRDEKVRPQVFTPRQKKAEIQRQMAQDLKKKAFGGSIVQFVLGALAGQRVSDKERAQIRELLDQSDK